jgi:hypothetical protein
LCVLIAIEHCGTVLFSPEFSIVVKLNFTFAVLEGNKKFNLSFFAKKVASRQIELPNVEECDARKVL